MRRRLLNARFFTAILLLAAGLPVQAEDAVATARTFFSDLNTLQADFHQEVINSEDLLQQTSDGQVWIQRPGKFRWNYETPYKQQLVADGERLWSYDEDLAQATVQPIEKVLSATPAMLLSGNEPLEQVFHMQAMPAGDNKLQVRLLPRSDDSNVTEIDLFFANDILARIEARDSFGNTTTFVFTNLVRNIRLDHDLFRFEPPPGADIVGEFE